MNMSLAQYYLRYWKNYRHAGNAVIKYFHL